MITKKCNLFALDLSQRKLDNIGEYMQPSPKPPVAVSEIETIAEAVGAKAPTAEAIIAQFNKMKYGVSQLGLVVTDIKKAMTGINGNSKKISELLSGVTDFIETDFNR